MDKTKDGCSTSSEEDNVAVSKAETVKKARNDELKKLKEKFAKVQKYNSKAVELEARRLNNDSYAKNEARQEWIKAKEEERKNMKLKGITEKNSHLLETAEANQRRAESKKEKEKNAVNNYGWNVFSEDSLYRGYEKRLKNLPTTPESAAKAEVSGEDYMDYAQQSRLSQDVIDRVVNDQKKRDEKNQDFSKRRTYFKQEKVDYISERNRSFNQRLGRYYDRFTADIRANLERGTAV
ncbi:hypothetical protein BLSTO_01035 [Blastocystis sp. subtype 1]